MLLHLISSFYISPVSISYIIVANDSHVLLTLEILTYIIYSNYNLYFMLLHFSTICFSSTSLLVITFFNNLIFIHELFGDQKCKVTIFTFHCVFHDFIKWKRIEIAKENKRLYYFSKEPNGPKVLSSYLQRQSSSFASQIWFLYKRLGHPPFYIIKSMFPSLFLQHFIERFKCDICLSKPQLCLFSF